MKALALLSFASSGRMMETVLPSDEPSFRLECLLKRLSAALDLLEAASERQAKADAARADLLQELELMQVDRQRLALELDAALARCHALEAAQDAVAGRLRNASLTVQTLLADPPGMPFVK